MRGDQQRIKRIKRMFGCVEINSGFNGFLLEWVDNGSNGSAIRSGGLRLIR